MRFRALFCSAAVLAASGFVHADHHPRRRLAESVRPPDITEQALSSLEQDERALRAEFDSVAGKESAVKRRMLARGRAMYRLVRVGLLPVGGGFGSLLDHAIKMERVRRALDHDMAEVRGLGDRQVSLAAKLDGLTTRRAPPELERGAATKARAP